MVFTIICMDGTNMNKWSSFHLVAFKILFKFYAVSQASFYPRLKKLRQGTPGNMKYVCF